MRLLDATFAVVLGITLGSSFMVCAALIATQKWHGRFSLDHDTTGAQKIHRQPVPRVGGIAIALSLAIGAALAYSLHSPDGLSMATLLICATPTFAAGLLEDLTKQISVRMRLAASMASALATIYLLDAQLVEVDTPLLDTLMDFGMLAMLFTCFAVSGVINSINIIDGVNGLASGSVVIMLGGLGSIAWMQGDSLVLHLCLGGIAALLGFMALNYPFGKIFLGDGGAYLAGFWLAECAVLLLKRNPDVSTWAVLLCCIYPVWETGYSMYRRHMVNRVNSGMPDMLHIHHLVLHHYSTLREHAWAPSWLLHAMTSSSIWMMVLLCQAVAVSGYLDTALMMPCVMAFGLLYQLIYAPLAGSSSKQPQNILG
ncbi:glycosyl transferase [Aquabacterium soli]|uniref:Glycosyl transferase n=1 Tax=Aquabacterium soli TaxID=2493092 RepID=A0A426VC05_9BURK|nr:glycosyltransferase [Aquabacterium soli]RRS04350.1 glycosyl transferase [Aquabacterium soli]